MVKSPKNLSNILLNKSIITRQVEFITIKYYTFAPLKHNILIIMNKGTVKFYDSTKRFGFIKEDGTDEEHFVHSSGLIDQIQENDKVEFELKEGNKGLNAVNVKVI